MTDLDRALSQLDFIQDRLSASTRFRGLAPVAVAATAAIAFALATAQSVWSDLGDDGAGFVAVWTAAAIVAAGLVGVEAVERSRRFHGGLSDRMIAGTLRLMLPFGAAGAAITLVVVRAAPEAIWMLPGLWQLLVALIGFAGLGTLPPKVVWPAGWYFACGTATLLLGAHTHAVTPWVMGLPFGIGQLWVAAVLHQGARDGRP